MLKDLVFANIEIFIFWCSVNLGDNFVLPLVQAIPTSVSPEAEVTFIAPKQTTSVLQSWWVSCPAQNSSHLFCDKPCYSNRATGESWNCQFNSKQICATLKPQMHSDLPFGHVKQISIKKQMYILTQSNPSVLFSQSLCLMPERKGTMVPGWVIYKANIWHHKSLLCVGY